MHERMTNMSESNMLSGREAAALLPGITYTTLMRWARQGQIPSTQYVEGGKRLFRREDIEALSTLGAVPRRLVEKPAPSSGEPPGQGALSL